MIQNVGTETEETEMCVDVEGGSKEYGTRLIQWPCKEGNEQIRKHRMFRFHQRELNNDWYFDIRLNIILVIVFPLQTTMGLS